MTAPCTDPRTLRDGDVVQHRAVVRAGAVICLDCGRKWAASSYSSFPEEHSYKPVDWMRGWLRRWTDPGDLVLDLYAGLGSVAVACALEGRRYIGAEIDPERHRRAVLRVEEAYNNRR